MYALKSRCLGCRVGQEQAERGGRPLSVVATLWAETATVKLGATFLLSPGLCELSLTVAVFFRDDAKGALTISFILLLLFPGWPHRRRRLKDWGSPSKFPATLA